MQFSVTFKDSEARQFFLMSYHDASVKDDVTELKLMSKKWYPKPPKKFQSTFINVVHSMILKDDKSDKLILYEILYATKYFDNILWEFYHVDITNHHIELILVYCLYEINIKSSTNSIDKVTSQDLENFDGFLNRILIISMTLKVDFVILSNIMNFMNKLVTLKLDNKIIKKSLKPFFNIHIWHNLSSPQFVRIDDKLLKDHDLLETYQEKVKENQDTPIKKLKTRWLFTLLNDYMSLMIVETSIEQPTQMYLKALLAFLVSLVSQLPLRMYTKTLIDTVQFISCFNEKNSSDIAQYVEALKYYLSYPINDFSGEEIVSNQGKSFESLQRIIFLMNNKMDEFVSKPSVIGYTSTELQAYLNKYSLDQLRAISDKIGFIYNLNDEFTKLKPFLVSIIINHAFPNSLKTNSNVLYDVDESKIVKPNAHNDTYSFIPSSLPSIQNTQYLSITDYLKRALLIKSSYLEKEILNHLLTVLDRLSIISPNEPSGIKGTSKYFASIETISKLNNVDSVINIKSNNKDWNFREILSGDLLIVIELQKPNHLSPHYRISKYGISKIRLIKVDDVKGNTIFSKLDPSIHSEKFNYLVRLPINLLSQVRQIVLLQKQIFTSATMPYFLNDLFLGIENGKKIGRFDKQANRPLNLLINCIDPLSLQSDYNISNHDDQISPSSFKQRKLNDGGKSKIKGNIDDGKSDENNDDAKSKENGIKTCIFKFSDKSNELSVQTIPYNMPTSMTSILNKQQSKILISSISTGLTMVEYNPHSGVKTLLAQTFKHLTMNYPNEKTLVVVPSLVYLKKFPISEDEVKWFKFDDNDWFEEYKTNVCKKNEILLAQITKISDQLKLSQYGFDENGENSMLLYKLHILPNWNSFLKRLEQCEEDNYLEVFNNEFPEIKLSTSSHNGQENLKIIVDWYQSVKILIKELYELSSIMKFINNKELENVIIRKHANTIFIPEDKVIDFSKVYGDIKFDSLIMINNKDLTNAAISLLNNNSRSKRVILYNENQWTHDNIFQRFKWKSANVYKLNEQIYNVRPEIYDLCNDKDENDDSILINDLLSHKYNPGFKEVIQIIKLLSTKTTTNNKSKKGKNNKKDNDNRNNTVSKVNIEDGQVSVAVYQYMRLLGYPRERISIVVKSLYQRNLIEEILQDRKIKKKDTSSDSRDGFKFGWPIIEMGDDSENNSEGSNDYVIACLFDHTSTIEWKEVKDVSRRGRFGVYIIGDISKPQIDKKLGKVDKELVTGNLAIYGSVSYSNNKDGREQPEAEQLQEYNIETVEQLNQYVYSMTKTRLGL